MIPSHIEYEVELAVLTVLKSGPPPWALGTDQARRPINVQPKAADEMMNGRWRRSGGTMTSGMYATYHSTTPTRSWVVMCEEAGMEEGRFFHEGDRAPSICHQSVGTIE